MTYQQRSSHQHSSHCPLGAGAPQFRQVPGFRPKNASSFAMIAIMGGSYHRGALTTTPSEAA